MCGAIDTLGRVNSSTNALGLFTGTYVGASNRLASLTYPNGQSVVYDYFNHAGDQRLKQIKNLVSGSSIISQFDYTYDAAGSIRTWKQFHSGLADPRQYDLGYDAVDQLTGAVLKNVTSGTTLSTIAYQYDKLGNRLSEQENSTVIAGTFDNLNQQLTRTGGGGSMVFSGSLSEPGTVTVGGTPATVDANNLFSGRANVTTGTNTVPIMATDVSGNITAKNAIVTVASGASRSFTYDLNGNTTNDGEKTYQWDAENRLVKIVYSDSTSSEFTYDGLSRRVQIVEKDAGGSVTETRKLVWDGLRIAQWRDGGNAVVRDYYGFGYRDASSSASFYYTKDHLGSIREIVSWSGTVAARYDYDLFGKANKISGGEDADFLYTGHYFHAASGLSLAPYRGYDAELGRWISCDPIGEQGGINLYGYVSNNPTNFVDFYGLKDYSAQETQNILDQAAKDASGWDKFSKIYENHKGQGKFDFKANQPFDTFCVNGERMKADEFGNYIAGYSAGIADGPFTGGPPTAYLATRGAGIMYDAADSLTNRRGRGFNDSNKFDFDKDSVPAIDKGYRDGGTRSAKERYK